MQSVREINSVSQAVSPIEMTAVQANFNMVPSRETRVKVLILTETLGWDLKLFLSSIITRSFQTSKMIRNLRTLEKIINKKANSLKFLASVKVEWLFIKEIRVLVLLETKIIKEISLSIQTMPLLGTVKGHNLSQLSHLPLSPLWILPTKGMTQSNICRSSQRVKQNWLFKLLSKGVKPLGSIILKMFKKRRKKWLRMLVRPSLRWDSWKNKKGHKIWSNIIWQTIPRILLPSVFKCSRIKWKIVSNNNLLSITTLAPSKCFPSLLKQQQQQVYQEQGMTLEWYKHGIHFQYLISSRVHSSWRTAKPLHHKDKIESLAFNYLTSKLSLSRTIR